MVVFGKVHDLTRSDEVGHTVIDLYTDDKRSEVVFVLEDVKCVEIDSVRCKFSLSETHVSILNGFTDALLGRLREYYDRKVSERTLIKLFASSLDSNVLTTIRTQELTESLKRGCVCDIGVVCDQLYISKGNTSMCAPMSLTQVQTRDDECVEDLFSQASNDDNEIDVFVSEASS